MNDTDVDPSQNKKPFRTALLRSANELWGLVLHISTGAVGFATMMAVRRGIRAIEDWSFGSDLYILFFRRA